jgi:hypothetical protein
MTLTFSEEEYRRLITLAFLGEWMVNAVRKEPDPVYEDVAYKIYAGAHDTALQTLVQFDEKLETWAPADAIDEAAHTMIDEYDEVTFWEELTARLTERDLVEEHGERAVRSMHPDKRERAAAPVAKAYTREFEESGLDRLRVSEE